MNTTVESQSDAKVVNRAATVPQLLFERVAESPDREAFRFPVGDDWHSVTWREFGDRAKRLAAGLIALGVEPEQRVGLASSTRYEWILADLAVMAAGAATTTVYPTTVADDVAYILSDSDSRVVFAEDQDQVKKLRSERANLPALNKVVAFDPVADEEADGWVIGLADLEKLGTDYLAEHPDVVESATAELTGEHLATLIYTSGTTGRPKGVRLVHDCWTYEGAAIDAVGLLTIDDLQFLWLPLAHVFGKVMLMAQLQVGFPTAVDGRVEKIVANLGVVKPTFTAAAPRIFEKAHGRIATMFENDVGLKGKLERWALGVEKKVSERHEAGREPGGLLGVQHRVADALVLSKVRERFGGRLRFFISGSARLNPDLARWFHAVGLDILEGYGLTETSAATFVNLPHNNKFGTVGPPLPGTEVRFADDGEVLVRGPGNMRGYHNLPELTDEVLDADGWLYTGDIGEGDDVGRVTITDRKKEIFKTSGGKYVAPALIEARFKTICPYAGQIVVHGETRNYCTALITLDPDAIQEWAKQADLADQPYDEIVTSEAAREMVQSYVEQLNSQLNRWETVKNFAILPKDLDVEDGEITPSMKVKRKYVEERYRDLLDEMYSS